MTQQTVPPPQAPRSVRARQSLGKWVFAAAVLASALLLGSLLTWALCIVTAALAIAVFLLWYDADVAPARPVATLLLATGLALTAYTALQAVPVPLAWVHALSPQAADVWARALLPLGGAAPSSATVSLDPIATRVQVLRGVAYLLAFVGALRIAQRREDVTFLQALLVTCGVVLAATALVHPAAGAEKVFWVYEPATKPDPRHVAPLLNANHLAAYLNIAACVALASALAPRSPSWRPLAFGAFLVLVATQAWVASRGGVAGGLLGVAVVVVLTRAARRGGSVAWAEALVTGAVIAAGVITIVLSASDAAWSELASSDVSKLDLAKDALRLVRAFPFTGVGRGAFEVAYPAVRTIPGYIDFTHPENVVAQWLTEWGVPAAALAFGAVAVALRPQSAMARSRPPVGAWGALVAVAVHNLVDFNLEVPAVVIALAVCAAIVTGGVGGGTRAALHAWTSRTRVVAIAAPALAVLGIAWVVPGMGHELMDDRRAVRDLAVEGKTPKAEFDAVVRAAIARHPAEPYLPYAGALRAARVRDESPMPWIERTLERANVYGPAHLVLAEWLFVRSPSQARLEYRLALEQDATAQQFFAAEAPRLVRSYDDAMELVPSGPMRAAALGALTQAIGDRLPATRARLDEALAKAAPDAVEPVRREAQAAISDLREEDAAPWCAADRRACEARALGAATTLRQRRPEWCEGYTAEAEVKVLARDVGGALDLLDDAANRVQDPINCLRAMVQIAIDARDDARADAALERIVRGGCATDGDCATNLAWVAQVEIRRGNTRRALAVYKQAYERTENPDILAAEAQLAAGVGLHAEALEGYRKLAEKSPGDARWQAKIAAERAALASTLLPAAAP